MAHSTLEGIGKTATEPTVTGIMQIGKERTEAMLAVQRELLDGYEEAGRAWIARVKSEVELWSDLAAKLSASASIPEGMEAYRECVSHRMQMAAEDGRRLFEEGQKIIGTLTKSFGNGLSQKKKS
ncbi:MAG TPA: phasin family protein [Xanthobacteraceae bacterium]|nr:phasin family protein [Xanthobacteraceae bacterium]